MRSKSVSFMAAPFLAGPLLAALAFCLLAAAPAGAVEIKRVISPGGIEAWLVEDHKNPIITLTALFKGGEAGDPAGKAGRANLASGLLDEGAGPHDSQAFRTLLEDDAIRLSFSAGRDDFAATLSTLTENADKAFELLRLSLTEPRFDAEPLQRIRAQIVANLAAKRQRPGTIAGRVWWRAMFPAHPYGMPGEGTPESLSALGADDLRAFVAETLTRDRLVLAVVGDITAAALAPMLDRVFGALPARSTVPVVADAAPQSAGDTFVVERDVPQSVVVFGHAGIGRDDPDWYAASILMEIMSGGFGSRLTEEIREKRGLTYGVSASLYPLDHAALVIGSVSTRNAKVAESIGLVREIWAQMAEDGPTEAEAADAKTYINGSFPLRFTNSGSIARILAGIQREGLGIDYLDRRAGLIDAVTMDDLKRVAKRIFRADALTFAIVGRPEGVTATRPAPATE
jgi:zinc protease